MYNKTPLDEQPFEYTSAQVNVSAVESFKIAVPEEAYQQQPSECDSYQAKGRHSEGFHSTAFVSLSWPGATLQG